MLTGEVSFPYGRTANNSATAADQIDKGKTEEAALPYRSSKIELPNPLPRLPTYLPLKGRENYLEWKKNFLTLAKSVSMSKYFIEDPIRPRPKQVTIENIKEATRDQRLDWE
jgi:hypothetical protein